MPLFIHPKRHIIGLREWDILATDPRVGVKGNRGADERERNYGRKTKRNLVSKQLFCRGRGERVRLTGVQLRSRHFRWQVMSLSRPLPHHVKLRPRSDWQSCGSYLMMIGRGPRAQEVTAWFPQSHPCEKNTQLGECGHLCLHVCIRYPCPHIFIINSCH